MKAVQFRGVIRLQGLPHQVPCPLFVTGDIYSEKVSIYRLIIENKGIASASQHQITDPNCQVCTRLTLFK